MPSTEIAPRTSTAFIPWSGFIGIDLLHFLGTMKASTILTVRSNWGNFQFWLRQGMLKQIVDRDGPTTSPVSSGAIFALVGNNCSFQLDPIDHIPHLGDMYWEIPIMDFVMEIAHAKDIGVFETLGVVTDKKKRIGNGKLVLHVLLSQDPPTYRTWTPTTNPFTIGRNIKSTLQIADPSVSEQHLTVTCTGKNALIEDIGSTNGTFINGKQIYFSTLTASNWIKLGHTYIYFEQVPTIAEPEELPARMVTEKLPNVTN